MINYFTYYYLEMEPYLTYEAIIEIGTHLPSRSRTLRHRYSGKMRDRDRDA